MISKMADQPWKKLVDAAIAAKERAYAEYSNFSVGAALLCDDGTIVGGCNIENAVYPLTVCAERTAVFKAVSDGYREFTAIAVVTGSDSHASPCGSCRQVLSEFSKDGKLQVVMAKPDGDYRVKTISELLPNAFSSEALREVQAGQGT